MSVNLVKPEFSIITPVFNRAGEVIESVKSSLRFLEESGKLGEVIVVDDASNDGSFETVSVEFEEQIGNRLVRVIKLPVNRGPTGAKQVGAEHAAGEWLIFMDSDDAFVAGASHAACAALASTPLDCPVVFFRCINKADGTLIGPAQEAPLWLDLKTYLLQGTPGECLPVVRRDCLLVIPYTEDLRGFEGLTYAALIQRFGHACVFPIILRSYCTDESGDRLSTRLAIKQRGCLIAKGYLRMILKFGFRLRLSLVPSVIRFFYHGFNCLIYSTLRRLMRHI
jgi:glycosyltransferase involved in cell wall biosynthesis